MGAEDENEERSEKTGLEVPLTIGSPQEGNNRKR